MKRAPAVAAIILGLVGCAHAPSALEAISLDRILAFSDPSLCEPADEQSQLLAAMVVGDADQGFRAGRMVLHGPAKRAFGPIRVERHEHYTVITVATNGTLFGLPLTGIDQSFPEGGDPGDVTYRFAASPQLVELTLRAKGFPAKAGEAVVMGPPDGYDHFIELLPDPAQSGHTLVSCGYR